MNWDNWLRTWQVHSESERFRRMVRKSIAITEDAIATGKKLYAGISGGKDSIALAWIVSVSAGGKEVAFAHAHTPLETPGMLDCAERCAEQLGHELDVIEPECDGLDFWEWFNNWKPGTNPFLEPFAREFRVATSSGNMLEAYGSQNGFRGAFTGVRAEESRARKINRKMRGNMYEVKYMRIPGWLMCNPIADWSARDVYAAIASHDLPICPHYRLAYERLGINPEEPNSRVDMIAAPERATTMPVLHQAKILYPELYRKVCECRPELRRTER